MATADVIAEVAYARFLREFDYGIIWPRVSMDVSAELSEYGDSISFPTDDSDPAETDITLANLQGSTLANHTWPDPGIGSQTDVTLTVAGKRINQLIPTTHQAQVRPSILNRRMELVARKMARSVNNNVRGSALGAAGTDCAVGRHHRDPRQLRGQAGSVPNQPPTILLRCAAWPSTTRGCPRKAGTP